MRMLPLLVILFVGITSCEKSNDQPKSKTDYIPINAATTPSTIALGQSIRSRVNCGFHDKVADITFLNFEVKESAPKQFEIRARAFYDNIRYGNTSTLTVDTFDTTLTLPTVTTGQYILKFYSNSLLVETDTVQVN